MTWDFPSVVLLLWPVFVLLLLIKKGIAKGSLISLLLAYMFLPAGRTIDLPAIPPLDKFSVTTITIIIFFLSRGKPLGLRYLPMGYKWLMVVFFVVPFLTTITNSDSYFHISGLSYYDGLTSSIINFLYFFPFLIGYKFFSAEAEQIVLLKFLAISGLIYSVFTLYEIRMSPQLHSTVYGYFPHSWLQQKRAGGFRAVVFMGHGLLVAMFLVIGFTSWLTLKKAGISVLKNNANILGLIVLFITVALSKTYSALLYGLFSYFCLSYLSTRLNLFAMMLLAVLFLTYPLTSSLGVFPHRQLVELANDVSAERAESLNYRFENENILLDHALDKPLFGWGGWGRNRVFDPSTGEDITTTDGYWVIVIGKFGWVGFLTTFIFVIAPLISLYRMRNRAKSLESRTMIIFCGHGLITALLLIDQIPNSSLQDNSLYWLVIGSFFARVLALKKSLERERQMSNTDNQIEVKAIRDA